MKNLRIFVAALLVLAGTSVMMAQEPRERPEPRNEFTVTLGVWPIMQNTSSAYDNCDFFTPVEGNFEFLHHASRRFAIGFDFSYTPILQDDDYYCSSCDTQSPRRGKDNVFNRNNNYRGSLFVIMPTMRMEWVKLPAFSLYSRVSLGLGVQTGTSDGDCSYYGERYDSNRDYNNQTPAKQTHCGFAFHVAPLGMTFGREVFGRVEFPGFGYEGIASIGIGYRF